MDEAVAIVLTCVLLFVSVGGYFFGAESRPAFIRPDRKPRFRMTGSMRRSDWPAD
jgi:hypothetical protein